MMHDIVCIRNILLFAYCTHNVMFMHVCEHAINMWQWLCYNCDFETESPLSLVSLCWIDFMYIIQENFTQACLN